MITTLSLKEFWEECIPQPSAHSSETIAQFPSQLGKGYSYGITLRSELSLTIRQYQLRDSVIMRNHPREHAIEFGFRWSGCVQDEYGNHLTPNQNILVGGVEPGGSVKWESKQALTSISIHIEPELLSTWVAPEWETLPKSLQCYLNGSRDKPPYFCVGRNSASIQVALSQILHCPYQGMKRRLYLESKALELITLKLNQMGDDQALLTHCPHLKASDIDLIVHAKEILLQQMDNPPSLLELARKVGLNDRKLKQGFRQVFGTTVFGCLHHYRLEKARSLLQETNLAVVEVARKVGYTSLSAFSSAFRKKYGINPRTYARSAHLINKSL